MAIGLGLILGLRLPQNFNYPYISQSITAFWRRWHMSLSAWFRDYLYIPLGGNRKGSLTVHFGTGIAIKSLEALGYGMPLDSTRAGVRGLDNDLVDVIVATDEESQMAQGTIDVLSNTVRAREMSRSAIAFAELYLARVARSYEKLLAAAV